MMENKQFKWARIRYTRLFLVLAWLMGGLTLLSVRAARTCEAGPAGPETVVDAKLFGFVGRDEDRPGRIIDDPAAIDPLHWSVPFWSVPTSDGTGLFVRTGRTEELATTVYSAVEVGQARHRYAMTYNVEESAYEATTAEILIPGSSTVEGKIGLSADLDDDDTLETPDVPFYRYFVPTTSPTGLTSLVSVDNNLEMTLSDHSLPANAYVLVMSANTIPGPLPMGHQLVGQPYSVQASGATVTSTKPMLFKLFYTDTTLGGVDPHTLSILQWNPVSQKWDDLGGSLDDAIEHSVSTTTDRFTVYALMGTTRWRDVFNDLSGLSEREHTEILLLSSELILDGTVLTGTAVSRMITPTVSIGEWGTVSYTKTEPAGTSLTIDVLDASNNVALSNIADGTSLATLDPHLYPSLKLRANLATDDLDVTPRLDEWSITWQPRTCKAYLPLILRL
jgi:hypothetical protein